MNVFIFLSKNVVKYVQRDIPINSNSVLILRNEISNV